MSTRQPGSSTVTGARPVLRLMARRERFALPWWLLGTTLLFLIQSVQSQNLYGTPEKLAKLRATMEGNAALVALSGPEKLLETIGGEVLFEILGYLAIILALMNMFVVGRNTRSDEETGRAELIRSTQVGRHAPLAAALGLALLADAALAVLVFLAAVGTGLPVAGSLLVAAALATVGVTFAGLTAIATQVFENARAAYAAVALALGVAYLLRAAGDVGNGAASWLSPIGWGQRTFPYVEDRWWPLLIPLAVTGISIVVAVALLDRRDFGAGLIQPRLGRPAATPALSSPLALAWRLQRGSVVGWALGVSALGAGYGSFGDSVEQYVADNPEIADYFPGGASDVVNSYLALTTVLCALLAAAFGVASTVHARGEEASGRAEVVLATATSRWSWLGGQLSVALVGSGLVLLAAGFGEGLAYGLTISDLGQVSRMMAVSLVYLPATWLLISVAVLGFGWLPRAAAAVAWGAFSYAAVVAVFAESFDLPAWTQQGSPLAHTPEAPLDSITALPLVALTLIVVLLLGGGMAGFRRRDVGY